MYSFETSNRRRKKRLNKTIKNYCRTSKWITTDRYCDDVLLQVASTTNALKSLGNEILKSHMKSCMVENIHKGNLEVIDDIINLFGKIK